MFRKYLVCIAFLQVIAVFAQVNVLNATTPEEMYVNPNAEKDSGIDEPIEYEYMDPRDILWGRYVWEVVDLDERVNFPLYFPVDTMNIGADRRSLYDVLISNVKSGKLNIYADSYFNEKTTLDAISAAISKVDTLDYGYEQYNAGETISEEYINKRNIQAADIEQYYIKGFWYFDKRQGELKYRILGLAPVAPDVNFIGQENSTLVPLFWVWFREAREILYNAKVFNPQNAAQPLSFDHLLNSRRFDGTIFRIDNIMGDRDVKDYISDNAMMQLIESQRLKDEIRNFELDLWSY